MSRRSNPSYAPVPAPAKGVRRRLDAAAVNAALEKQRAAEAANPPVAQMTLMDAVRLVAPLILERRGSGWTDPQIVALLHESLGVTITAETLRVYLHRIKLESGGEGNASSPGFPSCVAENAISAASEDKRSVPAAAGQVAEDTDHAPFAHRTRAPEPPLAPATPTEGGDIAPRFNPLVDLDEDI